MEHLCVSVGFLPPLHQKQILHSDTATSQQRSSLSTARGGALPARSLLDGRIHGPILWPQKRRYETLSNLAPKPPGFHSDGLRWAIDRFRLDSNTRSRGGSFSCPLLWFSIVLRVGHRYGADTKSLGDGTQQRGGRCVAILFNARQ